MQGVARIEEYLHRLFGANLTAAPLREPLFFGYCAKQAIAQSLEWSVLVTNLKLIGVWE